MQRERPEGILSSTYDMYFLHSVQIPIYAPIAKALQEEDGVDSILWVQGPKDTFLGEQYAEYTEVVDLLDDFFPEKLEVDHEANIRFLKEFEDSHKEARFFNDVAIDRFARTGLWPIERIAAYAVHIINRIEKELEANKSAPRLSFGENNHLAYRIAHHILNEKSIYVHYMATRHWKDRFYWDFDQSWDWPQCRETYNQFVDGKIPDKALEEARLKLAEISDEGSQPAYMNYKIHWRTNQKNRIKHLLDQAPKHKHPERDDPNRHLRAARSQNSGRIARTIQRRKSKYRRITLAKIATEISENQDFATFFLHYEPEYVVDGPAFWYRNQLAMIENVAASLPADKILAVKEHPSMIGKRDSEFYRRINSIPNVQLVPTEHSSHDLISKSVLVFSLAGTVALEAIYLGTPAIIFANMFFSSFRGVHLVPALHELPKTIDRALSDGRSLDTHALAALAAIYSASCPGKIGPLFDPDEIADEANVKNLLQSLQSFRKTRTHRSELPPRA